MAGKVAAVAIAFVVGMVLTSTPSYASGAIAPSTLSKGKIITMAGPPTCCGGVVN